MNVEIELHPIPTVPGSCSRVMAFHLQSCSRVVNLCELRSRRQRRAASGRRARTSSTMERGDRYNTYVSPTVSASAIGTIRLPARPVIRELLLHLRAVGRKPHFRTPPLHNLAFQYHVAIMRPLLRPEALRDCCTLRGLSTPRRNRTWRRGGGDVAPPKISLYLASGQGTIYEVVTSRRKSHAHIHVCIGARSASNCMQQTIHDTHSTWSILRFFD